MSTALLEDVLGEVTEAQAKRRANYQAQWWVMVKDIATGTKKPTPDRVDEVMNGTGKTIDDLRAAVALHQKRIAQAAAIASVPELQKEKAAAEKKRAVAVAEFEAAQRKYSDIARPIDVRMEEITNAITSAENGQEHLISSCPYDEINRQAREVFQEISRLHEVRREKVKVINEAKADLPRQLQPGEAENIGIGAKRGDRTDEEKYAIERTAKAEAAIAEIDALLPPLKKQEAALIEKQLVP
jgi:hypothetical protein